MWFFNFIIILFILLLLITVLSTIIELALKLVIKQKYEQYSFVLPSFLSIIIWAIIFFIMFYLLNKLYDINIFTILFESIVFKTYSHSDILKILLFFVMFSFVGILIQSFCLLTVNIDYLKLSNYIKFKFNKKENSTEKGLIIDEEKRLTYLNSLVTSLFIYSLVFFMIIFLLAIGNYLSKFIIRKL